MPSRRPPRRARRGRQAKDTTQPAPEAKDTTQPAPEAKAAADLARQAKDSAEPGRQAKDTTQPAPEAKDTTQPAPAVKDTADPTRHATDTTKGPGRSKDTAERTGWRQRLTRGWVVASAVAAFVVGAVGFYSDIGGIRSAWSNSKEPPLAIAFYEQDGSRLRLIGQQQPVEVTPEDVFGDRLRLPVRIAVSNRDNRRLDVVRVTLKYPSDLQVTSAGRAQIDPTGRTIVYEHDLGVLEAVDGFTPITPLDEVVVPFNFVPVATVVLAHGGVPLYLLSIVGAGAFPFNELKIALDVTVQASNRPPVKAQVRYTLEPGVQIVPQGTGKAETRPPTAEDAAAFRVPEGSPAAEWSSAVNKQGNVVHYRKYQSASGVVQAVAVDGVLRRLIVDTNADGDIDYELMDENGDGTADEFVTYTGEQFMVDWPADAAHP